ncbi:MAG: hypothetical protein DCF32_15395 [Leptolyngbya sp.]|nr:MAG: hypothetical protein DCF32_15395 [Leptolyngbya sp.]
MPSCPGKISPRPPSIKPTARGQTPPKLSGVDLRYADRYKADLTNANLTGAHLEFVHHARWHHLQPESWTAHQPFPDCAPNPSESVVNQPKP